MLSGHRCAEPVCHAGLFHSVYGTEGFRGFTLPTTQRETVRQVIGERAERVAFYNCVMDRHSLDMLVKAECHRRQSIGPAAATDSDGGVDQPGSTAQLRLRTRPTSPAEGEQLVLSEQDFIDLISVGLADHLEGWDHQMTKSGKYYISHTIDGVPGYYDIPCPNGWWGYRKVRSCFVLVC